jgi:hypothetical protein
MFGQKKHNYNTTIVFHLIDKDRKTAGDPMEQICGIRKFPLSLTSGVISYQNGEYSI